MFGASLEAMICLFYIVSGKLSNVIEHTLRQQQEHIHAPVDNVIRKHVCFVRGGLYTNLSKEDARRTSDPIFCHKSVYTTQELSHTLRAGLKLQVSRIFPTLQDPQLHSQT